jgi:flagellar biosynthetic protein FliR
MGLLDALQHVLGTLGFHRNVPDVLVVFGLAFTRIVTAISLTPFLGGQVVVSNIKVGLAVFMTVLILPGINAPEPPSTNIMMLVALLVKEAMIGTIAGFLTQLFLYTVQMAGAMVDDQRGMNQPGLQAPQLPGNVSVLGQLQFQAALVIFITLNGHLIFLRALARSFQQLPLFSFPHLANPVALAEQFGEISAHTLALALQLAAPILLTLFLVDVVFGAIGKVASQVNVYHESQPVKAYVGLVIFVLAIGFIFLRFQDLLGEMMLNLSRVLEKLA